MDPRSEEFLSHVHPMLAWRVRAMASVLSREGITIRVIQGLRTFAEQDKLYAQGRTTEGYIVTHALGGQSWHNFGLAVDCAPIDGNKIDWDAKHPAWKRMSEAGVKLGLVSGANWKTLPDAPHFQMNGRFPENAPNAEVRSLYAHGGIEAVWDAIVPIVKRLEVE